MDQTKLAAAAIALLSIASIQSSRAHAEQTTWFGTRSEDGASLIYGTPNSGYGKIALSCVAGQDDLSFVYEHEPVGAKDGLKVEVLLSAADLEVAIPTTGTRLEMDDVFILEGQTKLDNRLRDLLTSAGSLTVTIQDGAAEYPLDGAASAARDLLEVCSPEG